MFRGMMYCKNMNSFGACYLINYPVIAENYLANLGLFSHFRNHPSNFGIGLEIRGHIYESLNC